MKIAFCGKMASGKTAMADYLVEHFGFRRVSLANGVKTVAKNVFGMTHKDRKLLQQIGMKMREIEPDVWLDMMMRMADVELGFSHGVVCDDVRFINEAEKLRQNGWTLIKLEIQDELQKERLQRTYPEDWEKHWDNRDDPSEAEVDQIDLSVFAAILPSEDGDLIFERLQERFQILVGQGSNAT